MVYVYAPIAVVLIGIGVMLVNTKRRIGQPTSDWQGTVGAGVVLIAIGVIPLLLAVKSY